MSRLYSIYTTQAPIGAWSSVGFKLNYLESAVESATTATESAFPMQQLVESTVSTAVESAAAGAVSSTFGAHDAKAKIAEMIMIFFMILVVLFFLFIRATSVVVLVYFTK